MKNKRNYLSLKHLGFSGFSDAPYIRAEDIFDSFLAIVEDAIRFNLEYNTNFRCDRKDKNTTETM